jgi:REP element-mobilizing transposase RayT
MLIEIPPKYAVAQVIGYIKGKKAQYYGAEAKLHRRKLLSKRILCLNSGSG